MAKARPVPGPRRVGGGTSRRGTSPSIRSMAGRKVGTAVALGRTPVYKKKMFGVKEKKKKKREKEKNKHHRQRRQNHRAFQ